MRFLVDQALSPRFADSLNNTGHDAIHVQTIGMARAQDPAIFEAARLDARIVITADTDFGDIVALGRHVGPSIILFRNFDKRTVTRLGLLLANLPQVTEVLQRGAVVVIEDARIRVRILPIQ